MHDVELAGITLTLIAEDFIAIQDCPVSFEIVIHGFKETFSFKINVFLLRLGKVIKDFRIFR
jgi:hypothetical protein